MMLIDGDIRKGLFPIVDVQVYKALLHEVTEVAAKQLKASSEAQSTLFRREIAIHKRCRSVSFQCLLNYMEVSW